MKSRPPAAKFQDLIVWQKSHALVLDVYRLTSAFPKHEVYGLASPMRRRLCLLSPVSCLLSSVSYFPTCPHR